MSASADGESPRRPSPNKGRRFPAEPLTKREVDALIASCSNRAKTGVRNRALIAVLYRSGIRIGEALALKPADVDLDNGTVRVLHGKGDRSRTVGIDAGACALVERWLEARRQLVAAAATPVPKPEEQLTLFG